MELFRVRLLRILLISTLLLHGFLGVAGACPACWAGYGSGDERFNKPLADLRKIYEKKGGDALPYIKKTLTTSNDPLVVKRAAGYLVELNDRDSISLLEDILYALVKRVSFSSFGLGTYDYQCRLAAAHALAKFEKPTIGDRLWKKYDKLNFSRKSEIPYILNALNYSKLTECLSEILERGEDHQLVVGALNVMAMGSAEEAIPILIRKAKEWEMKAKETMDKSKLGSSKLNYAILKIKAAQAISSIKERIR